MNPETGTIYTPQQMSEMAGAADRMIEQFGPPQTTEQVGQARMDRFAEAMGLKMMKVPPTPRQQFTGTVDKYDLCPCDSGKQFKWCCWTGGRSK
ncbi:MAG: hypothetical protein COA96_17025 [SAR86 cluster bacterium]|uniref:Uncharacterized protein n=1 Tax=SAR86 cluster bacterium TaxID=2030880 RepID=A0A2A5AGV5_9GAMM|nr:MAG: hypothetical protein COA96_17025 [SAR86 cluster bacterium]